MPNPNANPGSRLRRKRKKAPPINLRGLVGKLKGAAKRGGERPKRRQTGPIGRFGSSAASRGPAPKAAPKAAPKVAPKISEIAGGAKPQARSTATTAQDLADVGYGTGMTTPPALTQRVTPVAPYEEGYAFGQTPAPTPAPAPDPFQEPDPYQKGRDFGASWPVTTPSGPVIPGVSGPPEPAGPATTLDYDVWGEDPPAQTPLWNPGDPAPTFDPDQPGQLERDYEIGNITPATPGIDTPLPDAAPGQMAPDPGYLPPPPEMDQDELDKLSAQVRLRKILQNPALRRVLRPPFFR